MEQRKEAILIGFLAILFWGSLATFSNLLLHIPPFYTLGLSFLLGGLPALLKPKEIFPSLKIFIVGVLGFFGYHFFLFYSFRYAPAIEANLINYLWPLFLVLLTPLFFHEEKLRSYHIAGALLSLVGCVLLVVGGERESTSENAWIGHLLALGAAITWPLYTLTKKKLPPTSPRAIGGFCFGAGILCLVTHALIEPRVVLQSRDAILIFIMGLGPFGLSFYCWDYAGRIGKTKSLGALAYLTPVISTLGLIFFAEKILTFKSGLAMVLIIGGASTGLLDFLPLKTLKKPENH